MEKISAVLKKDLRGRIYVDEGATYKVVMEFARKNKLPKVRSQFINEETNQPFESFNFSVKAIENYYGDSKQFRVYFSVGTSRNKFISSDKDGKLDASKFLKSAFKFAKEEQSYNDSERLKSIQRDSDMEFMKKMNDKLSGTDFEIDYFGGRMGRFEISASFYDRESLQQCVEKLLKLKKL